MITVSEDTSIHRLQWEYKTSGGVLEKLLMKGKNFFIYILKNKLDKTST